MIRLEQVSHRYGDRDVLREVDLILDQPRIGVVGANGSGKSTLARMLNGLVVPSRGRVVVDGLDTARDGPTIRRRVGFIFSDPDAQIVMPTVIEDIEFSLRRQHLSRSERRQRATRTLARFGLLEYLDHPAHLLSSGQKQLLAMASVLISEPDVLVCDEPTTLLDRRNTREIARLLAGLDQQVVLVTHDLELVAGWPRVVVLDEGRVVADGPGATSIPAYLKLVG